jgi:hypothetical protein
MSRRLEIELTSERPDGTWTWRAAGAKQPKGELSGSILPAGAEVGDVLRADADFLVEGIEILSVLPPKPGRKEPQRLEVMGTGKDEPLVTTQLAPKSRSRDGERRGGRGRDGGARGDRDRGDRDRGDRRERSGAGRGRSEARPRGPRPEPVPERPKPKRLRAGRQNRNAVLDALPVEHRPVAEQVLRGGVPGVREAINKQNEEARKENRPEVPAAQLVALAEELLPSLRAAEWKDRALAALADLDELDLRDLRSVVVAADAGARDEESRAMKAQLQEGLTRRVEQEQAIWIEDITLNLDAGRFVRALRLSSRPPKAGAPLPPELATRLILAVSEGLTPTVNQDLWAAAVDALAYAPVRNQVVPAGRPAEPSEALLEAVKRVGDRLPAIVELFGLDPAEVAKAAKRGSRTARGKGKGARPGATKPAKADRPRAADAAGPTAASGPAEGVGDGTVTDAPKDNEAPPTAEVARTSETTPQNETADVPVEGEGPPEVVVPAEAERAVAAELAEDAQPDRSTAEPEEPAAERPAPETSAAEEAPSSGEPADEEAPSSGEPAAEEGSFEVDESETPPSAVEVE